MLQGFGKFECCEYFALKKRKKKTRCVYFVAKYITKIETYLEQTPLSPIQMLSSIGLGVAWCYVPPSSTDERFLPPQPLIINVAHPSSPGYLQRTLCGTASFRRRDPIVYLSRCSSMWLIIFKTHDAVQGTCKHALVFFVCFFFFNVRDSKLLECVLVYVEEEQAAAFKVCLFIHLESTAGKMAAGVSFSQQTLFIYWGWRRYQHDESKVPCQHFLASYTKEPACVSALSDTQTSLITCQ